MQSIINGASKAALDQRRKLESERETVESFEMWAEKLKEQNRNDAVFQKVHVTFHIEAITTCSVFTLSLWDHLRAIPIGRRRAIGCGGFLQMLDHATLAAAGCPHFTHHLNVSDSFAGNN